MTLTLALALGAHLMALVSLAVLARGSEHARAYARFLAAAATIGERLIQIDPLRQSGYQWLMRAHVAMGNLEAARRIYHRCVDILEAELGLHPSDDLTQLYRTIG